MPRFDLNVKGLDRVKDRLDEVIQRVRREVSAELYAIGEEIMAASKEVVPVDTGNLMNSGHVRLPEEFNNEINVKLGYGGPAAGYALAVHENLNPNVNWKRPGSGPKYLENPLKERQDAIPGRIAAAARRGVKGD
jgi:hypothetical protein